MAKYKRGDKHPTKNLYYFRTLRGKEMWLSKDKLVSYRKKSNSYSKKLRSQNPYTVIINNIKGRSKKKQMPSDVTPQFLKDLLKKQEGKCYWFGIEMTFSTHDHAPTTLTVDRLDNSKGYLKTNVVLCCLAANRGRGVTPVKDWVKFIETFKK